MRSQAVGLCPNSDLKAFRKPKELAYPAAALTSLTLEPLFRRSAAALTRNRLAYLKLTGDNPILESHLVFKNPVPMKYALSKLSERVSVSLIGEVQTWAQ